MIGQKFGRLLILEKVASLKSSRGTRYLCKCECGTEKIFFSRFLKSGNTKSCGCLMPELAKIRSTKHGRHNTPEYKTWHSMLQRCLNPNNEKYEYYGGRGITVKKEWLIFENFFKDMGERPKGKTIDRKENDKGYYKENCRWANSSTQALNKRKTPSKSGFRGVWPSKNKWSALIKFKGKREYLGIFSTPKEAAETYLQKYFELHNKWPPEYSQTPLCYKSPFLFKDYQ